MGSYRWSIEHECSESEAEELLLDFGFELTDDDDFAITINDWKPLNASLLDRKIEFSFHWMGDSTTEVYFDYLINCGVLLGQLLWALEDIAVDET